VASPAPLTPFEPAADASAAHEGRAAAAIGASVRAHPLLIAVVTLATVLAGVTWSAARAPTYESSAQVLLTPLPETGRSLPRLPLLRVSSDRTRLAQTAANLLDSPAAAAATADALGNGWTAERVAAAVDVEPVGESDVLSLTAKADDPEVAARLADEFASATLAARDRALRPIVASLISETERNLQVQQDQTAPVALDLAQRLADLRAIGTEADPTLSLTRHAEPSGSPIGAPRWLLGLLSLVAGVAVGLGSALIVDMIGPRRVADAGHAVATTGLPILARVPALGLWQRIQRSSVRFRPAAAAQLRMLQHQLALQPESRRWLLLTGVSARDGVTTSVAELGLTLVRAGHQVLLVDLDTREPTLAARLGAPEPAPLSDMLARGEYWEDGVVAVPGAPHLKLLAIGRHGPMGIPDEVAAGLPDVLTDARGTFDYVLLDAPPLGESGEALQVASAVDAVVLVVRPGSTRLLDLETALDMLDRAGRRPEGLLLVGGRGAASSPPGDPKPVGVESAPGATARTRTAST
jgi:Mrp family chromosome partitioning ATPase/capsular polysaccharide biosynthesis protein